MQSCDRGNRIFVDAMITIAKALGSVLEHTGTLETETLEIGRAVGRVLGESIAAPFAVPGFANSQMDGFAVRASDLAGTDRDSPVSLRVLATVGAGKKFEGEVAPGQCVRIMTGAPMPSGADTVVPIEDVVVGDKEVRFAVSVAPGRFVRAAGDDFESGTLLLSAGRRLRAADLGLMASIGKGHVVVRRRPRVGILGTGSELVAIDQPLAAGQIHDSNAYTLAGAVEELGGEPERLGIVADEPRSLRSAFERASGYDVILSTGGVSVGDFDYVKDVLQDIGLRRHFWRVAQKPGKPVVFASGSGGLYFGLPGNPVSAAVCFVLYVGPCLRRLGGRDDVYPLVQWVELGEEIRTASHLTELVRCAVEEESGKIRVRPTGTQSSGALRSMSLADGLVISPPGHSRHAVGEQMRMIRLYPPDRASLHRPFEEDPESRLYG
jgi:molybdopterin molybdotransferase